MGGDGDLLPAAARRARRGPGPRHAVAHARALRPARGAGGGRALPRLPARRAGRDPPPRHRGGARIRRSRASSSAPPASTPRPPSASRRAAATWWARSRRTRRGRRRPPTPCCRCWPRPRACACSSRRGSRRTAARFGHVARRAVAARVRLRAVARRGARGGRRARRLRRPHRRARATAPRPSCARCAPARGRCSSRSTGRSWTSSGTRPAIPRTAPTATRAATPSTATRRGRSTAPPMTPRARPRRCAPTPSTSSPRSRAGSSTAASACARSTRSCSATSGTRGSTGWPRSIEACDAAGVPLAGLDEALAGPLDAVPAPAGLPPTSWGEPRDLRTWSGPAAGELAVARAQRRAAGPRRGRRRAAGAAAPCASCSRSRPPTGRSGSAARRPGRTRASGPTGMPPTSSERSRIRAG